MKNKYFSLWNWADSQTRDSLNQKKITSKKKEKRREGHSKEVPQNFFLELFNSILSVTHFGPKTEHLSCLLGNHTILDG